MKNIKKFLIPFFLLVIFIAGLIIYTKNLNPKTPEVCIQDTCFSIEIADTPEERQRWLMYRQELPELSGMLFVFERTGVFKFWMKDTLIPLDMIWINDQNKIIDIEEAMPCTQDPCPVYGPEEAALYVLELNKGISKKYGIKIGDTIEINQ